MHSSDALCPVEKVETALHVETSLCTVCDVGDSKAISLWIWLYCSCTYVCTVHRGSKQPMQQSKEEEEPPKAQYIPVVGENEPELMPAGNVERQRKKKLDQSQMATDDFHYDRFRKKTRMF